jgi:hypothetical protein
MTVARDGVLPLHVVERNMPYQADPRKGLRSLSADAGGGELGGFRSIVAVAEDLRR